MAQEYTSSQYFRIADVARMCGISASTLRFWEQHDLIKPDYTESGQRVYSEAHLEEIRDIQRLRVIQGLSLAAIRAMLGRKSAVSQNTHAVPSKNTRSQAASSIGPQLRALRKKKGLSLREVASKTGLAASLISTLERTSLGASAASTHKLAEFYDTTLMELSTPSSLQNKGETGVIRAGDARIAPMLGPDIRIEQRAHRDAAMDCQKWTLLPGAGSEEAYSHEGEEFIYVLRGLFEIELDGHERHLLYPGDTIYFNSTRSHSWRNPGEEESVLVWVNTPPTF